MQIPENQRVLIFLSVVAAVYVLAAGIVVRSLLNRFAHRPAQLRPIRRWSQRIILGIALVGLSCIAYGYFIEPYWPEVTHVQIKTVKLGPGSQPVRIAHISDLHCDPKPRLEERLPDIIAAQKPDLIVITGDTLNSPDGLPILRSCLTRLPRRLPFRRSRWIWCARRCPINQAGSARARSPRSLRGRLV